MIQDWTDLENQCKNCQRCDLAKTRHNTVIGKGNNKSQIMFIGEGPGHDEDMQGLPFVGKAGQLLDKMLAAIDLNLSNCYICNTVKCRPPQNRDPNDEEQQACKEYLDFQIKSINPRLVVCLGRIAAQALITPFFKITKEQGLWFYEKDYKIMAIYHPSALLRDETKKRPTWEALKIIKSELDKL
ncbi:MAG: uracil-DNA glycosylase [Rickettsiales bacterium]|jgi:DNA polymerase|nr:uracil-DNA glycosylase [Rickettsiales bacterium]